MITEGEEEARAAFEKLRRRMAALGLAIVAGIGLFLARWGELDERGRR